MKIGMNLLLWTDSPAAEHLPLLNKMKYLGFDGVELPLDFMTDKDVALYARELNRLSLGATGIVSLSANVGDPISEDPKRRAIAMDYFKKCMDKAVILGITTIAGPLYQGLGRFTGSGPTQAEIDRCVAFFRELIPYAQERNIVLAGEAINRFETFFVNTVDQACKIIDAIDSPNFGLHVDTYHGNFEELDICASWKFAGSRIRHVHISENTRGIPGTGCAIPPAIFQVLKEINYDGWLTIEAFSRDIPALASRLHIWREMASADDIARLGYHYIADMMERHGIPRG